MWQLKNPSLFTNVRFRWLLAAIAVASSLAACSSTPVLGDQLSALKPDEGLAAIVVDGGQPVQQLVLVRDQQDRGTIHISMAPAGRSLHLVTAKAGRYCVAGFLYRGYRFIAPGHDVDCFIVQPGHVAYAGSFIPTAVPGNPNREFLQQLFEPRYLLALLYRDYPAIAAKYPIEGLGLPAGRGAGVLSDYRSSVVGTEHVIVSGAQVVYFRNNASWKMEIDTFHLTNCANVQEECVLAHPQLVLNPGQEKQVIVVHGKRPSKPFSFNYHYTYHRIPKRLLPAAFKRKAWTSMQSFSKGLTNG